MKLRIVENVVIEFRNRSFKPLYALISSNFILNVIGNYYRICQSLFVFLEEYKNTEFGCRVWRSVKRQNTPARKKYDGGLTRRISEKIQKIGEKEHSGYC